MSDSEHGWNLTLTVDAEAVVRVEATTPDGSPAKSIAVTPRELGLMLTALLKGVLAQEGDDVQMVSLN